MYQGLMNSSDTDDILYQPLYVLLLAEVYVNLVEFKDVTRPLDELNVASQYHAVEVATTTPV